MPFIKLFKRPEALRFSTEDAQLQYFVSTPDFHTFRKVPNTAATFSSSPVGESELLPDPDYPIVFFLPSETLACGRIYGGQLQDERLADRFNIVAVDPRVHGISVCTNAAQAGAPDYDLDIKAVDVLDFIDLLCERACGSKSWPGGIHLVGSSLSGLVGLRIASMRPNLVRSITYTSPLREEESADNIEAWKSVKDAMMEDENLPNELLSGFEYRWGGEKQPIPPQVLEDFKATWRGLTMQENGREAARRMWFSIYWHRKAMSDEALARIKCPVMVAEGEDSLPYEQPCGELLKSRLVNVSNFTYVTVPQAPFLLSVTHPTEVSNLIVWHLDNHEPSKIKTADTDLLSDLATLSIDSAASRDSSPNDVREKLQFPPGISFAEAKHLVSMLATPTTKPPRLQTRQHSHQSWMSSESSDDESSDGYE